MGQATGDSVKTGSVPLWSEGTRRCLEINRANVPCGKCVSRFLLLFAGFQDKCRDLMGLLRLASCRDPSGLWASSWLSACAFFWPGFPNPNRTEQVKLSRPLVFWAAPVPRVVNLKDGHAGRVLAAGRQFFGALRRLGRLPDAPLPRRCFIFCGGWVAAAGHLLFPSFFREGMSPLKQPTKTFCG